MFKVVPPVCSNRLLATYVPKIEVIPSMIQGLDVEPERRFDRISALSTYRSKDSSFSGIIESENQYPNLFLLLLDLGGIYGWTGRNIRFD